ncbi:MAG: hypothetical protein NVSMB13_15500 [Mycobacteriales bacterium]
MWPGSSAIVRPASAARDPPPAAAGAATAAADALGVLGGGVVGPVRVAVALAEALWPVGSMAGAAAAAGGSLPVGGSGALGWSLGVATAAGAGTPEAARGCCAVPVEPARAAVTPPMPRMAIAAVAAASRPVIGIGVVLVLRRSWHRLGDGRLSHCG